MKNFCVRSQSRHQDIRLPEPVLEPPKNSGGSATVHAFLYIFIQISVQTQWTDPQHFILESFLKLGPFLFNWWIFFCASVKRPRAMEITEEMKNFKAFQTIRQARAYKRLHGIRYRTTLFFYVATFIANGIFMVFVMPGFI